MNCCRKSKRPKHEVRPLEYGVVLEEEMDPLAEPPDTSDENDRQKAAREKLIKILEEMEKDGAPLESTSRKVSYLLSRIRQMKEHLLDRDKREFFVPLVWRRIDRSDIQVLILYGTNVFVENLLEAIKDDFLKERISKIKGKGDEKKKKEEEMMKMIKEEGNFEEINKEITPRSLANCQPGSLLMAMKVSFQLRELADKRGADEEKFNQLANSVEAFISSLLDPLRSDKELREDFGVVVLDNIIDDAIDLDQKKFFTHPVVEDEMERKFIGRYFKKSSWNWWQVLLFRFFCFWCAVDWCIFPITFTVISFLKKRSKQVKKRESKQLKIVEGDEEEEDSANEEKNAVPYQMYWSPYAKYLRDTLSYVIMVVLHYALCLSPSTIAFSRLELVILIFFVGRFLVERQQIWNIMQRIKQRGNKDEEKKEKERQRKRGRRKYERRTKWNRDILEVLSIYLSDPWNLLDFLGILIYLIILILRVTTLLTSGSEMNNRVLAIAGYLYSFNTLCLTLRVFGYVTEQSRHLGVIQIALFNILKDIATIILQFLAAILAFSIAITKVYMTEKSFIANGNARDDIACSNSGLSCWWAMVTHLGWSLLGQLNKSDLTSSVDFPSDTIAQILYAAFLVFAVVLLLNMLIALLCNTYQRIEDNSLKVWLMKRAVTIRTYDAYDPVPVPLDIVYNIGKLLIWLARKLMGRKDKKMKGTVVLECCQSLIMETLEKDFFEKHGEDSFPATDEDKIELMLYKQNENRQHLEQRFEKNRQYLEQVQQLVGQVLFTTPTSRGGDQGVLCSGSKMWEYQEGMRIEGPLVTCKDVEGNEEYGARYLEPFSVEFPHFEVIILEFGELRCLSIGVVQEDNGTCRKPGWYSGTVGYNTVDGEIYHNYPVVMKTKGHVMASRGDRIRCTVMFENEKVMEGKKEVSVMFFLNGRKIITRDGDDQFFIDSDGPLFPYICMLDGESVLAKMCPRKDEVTIEDLNRKLNTLLTRMTDVKKEHEVWKVHSGITIEGQQLTCECRECAKPDVCCLHGARCRNNLSPEFPHFEVVILETGERRKLGIGVVNENYYMNVMPGWDTGSVGYHIDDGIIYPDAKQKGTKGKTCYTCFERSVRVHRGDRIRCTVMFENEIVINGKVLVPIAFFLNGRKIITQEGEDQFYIDFNKPFFPYICMTDRGSVLAKVCPREEYKIEHLDSKVAKSLGKTKWTLNKMWDNRKGIRIEGSVLTCEDVEEDERDGCKDEDEIEKYGARYLKPFSPEFPHFEVVILETGEQRLGIGVVYEDYGTDNMPGWGAGTVGYHTNDGIIYQVNQYETKGPVKASRGDRIRCTVMFENEEVIDGEKNVPILFFLNGSQIVTKEDEQVSMDPDKALFPYIGMTNGCSAIFWAKMLRKDKAEA